MQNDLTTRAATAAAIIVAGGLALLSAIQASDRSARVSGAVASITLLIAGLLILVHDWRVRLQSSRQAKLSIKFLSDNDTDFTKTTATFEPGEVPKFVGFLEVHNIGTSAVKCWATVAVNSGIPDWPQHLTVSACWRQPVKIPKIKFCDQAEEQRSVTYGDSVEIESGGKARIIVAERIGRPWSSYRWSVPHWSEGALHNATTEWAVTGGVSKPVLHKPVLHITVVIKSDPPPVDNLPLCSIILEGEEIREDK
jgi:hypothetical protein